VNAVSLLQLKEVMNSYRVSVEFFFFFWRRRFRLLTGCLKTRAPKLYIITTKGDGIIGLFVGEKKLSSIFQVCMHWTGLDISADIFL